MKEEIYVWMKNLAVFYILFTAVLYLVPDLKYQRYIRSFMGLLIIIRSVFLFLGFWEKGKSLQKNFFILFSRRCKK